VRAVESCSGPGPWGSAAACGTASRGMPGPRRSPTVRGVAAHGGLGLWRTTHSGGVGPRQCEHGGGDLCTGTVR